MTTSVKPSIGAACPAKFGAGGSGLLDGRGEDVALVAHGLQHRRGAIAGVVDLAA